VAPGVLVEGFKTGVLPRDLVLGLVKSIVFGLTVGWICSYKGFFARLGAEGVGRATTDALVASSVMILIWDYVLNAIML
jgi:phospholipid/cholesterol/gamma-HCH transport system permease protein